MFSSNPSLEIPSSSIHVSPSYFDHDHDYNNINIHGVYFMPHEHNSNPVHVSADCFLNSFKTTVPPPSPPLPVATANTQDLISQQLHEGSVLQYSDDYDDLLESIVYPCKKKTVNSKKDGHSKIYTAQGPRDRRVRLSIDIARKFFELQSLLGFDKASKTLDWLFTKSKVAIRELVEQTKHSSSSIVTTGICESAFLDEDSTEAQKKAEFKFVNGKMKKMAQKHKSGHHVDLAREQSRAEARARARERTKEKWRIQKQQYELSKFPDECSYHAVSSSNLKLHSSFWGQIESENVYNEPIVEKRLFRSDSGFEPVSESGN